MPDHFKIDQVNAVAISATATEQKKVTVADGASAFYKTASDVDTEDTELAKGESVTIEATNWFISETSVGSRLIVETLSAPSYQDVSVTDDLTVTDKAILKGEVEIDGDLNHDGSKAGFFATAPAARPEVAKEEAEEKKATTAELQEALETLGLIKEEA